tara:strand:- start:2362 stop:3435 length:1074 start_codon:yes stop_codon:yes gene_type:complete
MELPFKWMNDTMRWNIEQMERNARYWDAALVRYTAKPSWATDNQVVFELPALRLRQFGADSSCDEIPTVIVAPQVNHSSICDYSTDQSLVSTLMDHGLKRVYAVEWKSATLARSKETLDDALDYVLQCIDELGGKVRLVGLCQGGWMSLILAAVAPEKVESLVLAAAPVDFHADPGPVNIMARYIYPMAFYKWLVMMGGGVMRGELISRGFDSMRPFERYVLKYLDLYANVDNEEYLKRFKRLDVWYGIPQNIPGLAYLRIVRELFKENRLVKGTFTYRDQTVDLSRVNMPTHLLTGARDHITKAGQLLAAADHISTPSEKCYTYEADAGHVGVFMSKKALKGVWPTVAQRIIEDGA